MTVQEGAHHPKVLIIGIDGATFSLIKPWANDGKLPMFRRLLEDGVHADLKSTVPPVTAPAWTSFMTGKNPGKHGLYHFIEPQPGGYEVRYTNTRSRLARSIWEIMSESGLNVGVINVPMTYPPEPVNGFMISGLDAPEGSQDITHPPGLYQELAERFGKVSRQIRYLGYLKNDPQRDALLESLSETDDHYLKLTEYLLEKYPVDVAMVVFTSTDTVQHFFWHYMDESHPNYDPLGTAKYREAIFRVYQKVDGAIEELTSSMPDDTTVVLMSDHGFGPTGGRSIHLNRHLMELGLLSLRGQNGSGRPPTGLFQHMIKKADSVLRTALTPRQKAKIAGYFPRLRRKWESHTTGLAHIDWQRTKAYCYEVLTFPPGIWINVRGRRPHGTVLPGSEYDRLLQSITDSLYALKDPVTGEQLIHRVFRKEEIYQGPYLDMAPDLTPVWWDRPAFLSEPSFPENGNRSIVKYTGDRVMSSGEWSGTHTSDGVLFMKGRAFQKARKLERAEIIDLAPTLLYLLGLPIPDDMDGRVLEEAFAREFASTHRISSLQVPESVQRTCSDTTYTDEEAARVAARLRDLGYID